MVVDKNSIIDRLSSLGVQSYGYLSSMMARYLSDKTALDPQWVELFDSLEGSLTPDLQDEDILSLFDAVSDQNIASSSKSNKGIFPGTLIEAYRSFGSTIAKLDPLKISKPRKPGILELSAHGLRSDDLVDMQGMWGMGFTTAAEVLRRLEDLYCGSRSMDVGHISNTEERRWLIERFESLSVGLSDKQTKLSIYRNMLEVDLFEQFLHLKFVGAKRFSIEGSETSMVVFETLIETLAALGYEEFVMGMPHRGRLGCLVRIVGKDYSYIISEFMENQASPNEVSMSGDVKYHIGASVKRSLANGKDVTVSLTPNPSHLEAVNTVTIGRVKAKQVSRKTDKIACILSHGDSAFSGQGVVYEGLQMANLEGYGVGGTIHVVVNNQIGFTTEPEMYASSRHPTDIVKFLEIPVFHVNADDPESAYMVAALAAEYRAKFTKDVAINVVGYRKYGHNEGDEPAFTQPLMYQNIANRLSPRQMYEKHLIDAGVLTASQVTDMVDAFKAFLSEAFSSNAPKEESLDWLSKQWSGFVYSTDPFIKVETGTTPSVVNEIANALSIFPEGYTLNPKVGKLVENRLAALRGHHPLDWGTAEWLALASLMVDDYSIRISGQDAMRGTFSHRHAVLFDYKDNKTYRLFSSLEKENVRCDVISSTLSEYGVLGFEYGYSTADPRTLVIWEAQYGDFANGAQIIFDQFISSAELKWLRMSGLTVLLPHGYEGQGPEHSSARIERYLQSCAENNMRVVNCTTPANYFHALRRQMIANVRKPLIVFSPKSLLRNKSAVSDLSSFLVSSSFSYIIGDNCEPDKVTRVILCSGKIYYDLDEERKSRGIDNVAIVRIEQLYPLSEEEIMVELMKYPNINSLIWCQEEPKNMGPYSYMLPHLSKFAQSRKVTLGYAGRPESAATAVGYHSVHMQQQSRIISSALS